MYLCYSRLHAVIDVTAIVKGVRYIRSGLSKILMKVYRPD